MFALCNALHVQFAPDRGSYCIVSKRTVCSVLQENGPSKNVSIPSALVCAGWIRSRLRKTCFTFTKVTPLTVQQRRRQDSNPGLDKHLWTSMKPSNYCL